MKKNKYSRLVLCLLIPLVITAVITGKCLKLINSELIIKKILSKEIDFEEFRNIRISKKQEDKIKKYSTDFIKKNPHFKGYPYMDDIAYLTFSMLYTDYDLVNKKVPNTYIFNRGIGRLSKDDKFRKLYSYYKAIFSDLKYFPVPYMGQDAAKVSYEDSWNAPRTYGGDRRHEGTDLMAENNIPGYFPIISITDGVVEKMGWLEKGGNRIGIRAESGAYFYYAHLDTYAPGLKIGDKVIAGQLLGFMGDTGYGKEGTKGKFDVHLHLGIYLSDENQEMSVNPYWILKIIEDNRTELLH